MVSVVCVTVFTDRHEDKILYPVSLQINQGLMQSVYVKYRGRILVTRIGLRSLICLSSFYKDLERGLFPKKLRLTKEQGNSLWLLQKRGFYIPTAVVVLL